MENIEKMLSLATRVNLFREGKPQWQDREKERLLPIAMNLEGLTLRLAPPIQSRVGANMFEEELRDR